MTLGGCPIAGAFSPSNNTIRATDGCGHLIPVFDAVDGSRVPTSKSHVLERSNRLVLADTVEKVENYGSRIFRNNPIAPKVASVIPVNAPHDFVSKRYGSDDCPSS
jgi:hypothetical protein